MPRNQPLDDDDDDDVTPEDDSKAIKAMRARIKELEKDTSDAVSARRENAMLRAGIDVDSKLGKMFLKSYEGDFADVAAIKAEAAELGLIKTDAAPEPPKDDVPAPTDTDDRRTLANGAMPDDKKVTDVRADAFNRAQTAMDKGLAFDKAAGGYIASLAEAAMNGDQSVVL